MWMKNLLSLPRRRMMDYWRVSFKNTVETVFVGTHSSSDDIINFIYRVRNITDKEDYMKICLHTLLKGKEGRINFVIECVDWVRSLTPQYFDFAKEYVLTNPTKPINLINIFNTVETMETQVNFHDTFSKIYKRGRNAYGFNNTWMVAVYIINASVHFKDIRRENHYYFDFSRQWVTCKLYNLFSTSYSYLQMYWFVKKNDNKNESNST